MAVQTSYGTTLTRAIEGALADSGAHDCVTKYSSEASACIAFGRAVKFGANDFAALLPTAQADKIVGIVVHSNQYSTGPDGELKQDGTAWTNGLRPGAAMTILRKGRIWAKPGSDVTPGDRLYVRRTSAESGVEFLGGLEDAADSTDMIDCTAQGVWLDTASAGGLARLEVDFTNKP